MEPSSRIEHLSALLRSDATQRVRATRPLHTVTASIAGIPVRLSTSDNALAEFWSTHFAEYRTPGAAAHAPTLRAEPARPSAYAGLWPGIWEDEDPEFRIAQASVFQRDFCALRVAEAEAFAWLAPDQPDATHNALRWFMAPLLLRHQALLLHGAGAIRNSGGYVFFGASGAGKSTAAGWIRAQDPQATVVGDDSVILRLESEVPYLYSAPLGCGYSTEAPPARRARLAGCYHLVQSDAESVRELAPARATALLIASAMFTEDRWEERARLAERFVRRAPGVADLYLRNAPNFWNLVLTRRVPVP
jgi:hypothetical protein